MGVLSLEPFQTLEAPIPIICASEQDPTVAETACTALRFCKRFCFVEKEVLTAKQNTGQCQKQAKKHDRSIMHQAFQYYCSQSTKDGVSVN